MKPCYYLYAPAVIALTCVSTAWSQTPIGTIHCNDANGVPLMNGMAVTVRGIVTGNQPTGSASRFYIQDATGGINIFGSPQHCGPLGDDVEVSGTIGQFNGITEVLGPLTITVHSSGNAEPAPFVYATPNDFNNKYDTGTNCEPNESALVRLSTVFIRTSTGAMPPATFTANTNYRLIHADADSATNFTTMRVVDSANNCAILNSLVGQPINAGCQAIVTGINVQFDSTSPFTSGYQLTPRGASDVVVDCVTRSHRSTWGGLKAIYR